MTIPAARKFFVILGSLAASALTSFHSLAFYIPDYYDEPGSSLVRSKEAGLQKDAIDPFGGQLTVQSTDLFIPGNGGLDIEIIRNYSTHNAIYSTGGSTRALNGIGSLGVGWDIHFGRVWYEENLFPGGCKSNEESTIENPVFELPDGSRHLLVNAGQYIVGDPATSTNQAAPDYVSKNYWSASCINEPYVVDGVTHHDGGMEVKSPDGTIYKLNRRLLIKRGTRDTFSNTGYRAWVVTEIRDPRDNWIKIEYLESVDAFGNGNHPARVTSSDGREIEFEYDDEGHRLIAIHARHDHNEQTVQYEYEGIPNFVDSVFLLSKVIRPDGGEWNYTYKTNDGGNAGNLLLESTTSPLGGTTEFTYQFVWFETGIDANATIAVSTRSTFGGNLIAPPGGGNHTGTPEGVWNYHYTPGIPYDETIVEGPTKVERYQHFSVRGAINGSVWRIGSLHKKEIFAPNTDLLDGFDDTPLQEENYEWEPQYISSQNESRPSRSVEDTNTYVPLLARKEIVRSGVSFETEYNNYTVFGKPQQVIETGVGQYGAFESKTTTFAYYHNLPKWIVLPQRETIEGAGQTYRNYFDNGLVENESTYGVARFFEYDAEGNLTRSQDGYGRGVSYSDYYRGVPQQEEHEEGVTIARVVNGDGTIAEETNGRGHTSQYQYDDLLRIEKITPPINSATDIAWPNAGKKRVLTRGGLTDEREYDGFGREIKRTISGEEPIVYTKAYDVEGRLIFESYPNSNEGVEYEYDALGRVTRRNEPEGKVETYNYLQGSHRVRVTDGRNNVKTFHYRSFGDPDQADLVLIEAEEGVTTEINRDKLGNITRVAQNGVERTFEYNDSFFLTKENHPELGEVDITVDAVGNVIGRKVGGQETLYDYDDLYRLTLVQYPSKLDSCFNPCVVESRAMQDLFSYDEENNTTSVIKRELVESTHGNGSTYTTQEDVAWSYNYNENNSLLGEQLTAADEIFQLAYSYNLQDSLNSITYPSGLVLAYSPDAYGRPTQVGAFATNVQYHPGGQLSQWQSANGTTTTIALNARQLPSQIQAAGSQPWVDLSYTYDANNNIVQIADAVRSGLTNTLAYDGLDRLITASGQWGNGAISYDAVGNIDSKTIGSQQLIYTYNTNNLLTDVTGAAQLYNFVYDEYGNVVDNGSHQFNYDDAGNLLGLSNDSIAFYYDGNNRRTVEIKDDKARFTLYGQNGRLMYESDTIKGAKREYIYLGNQQVARRDYTPGVEIQPPADNFFDMGNNTTVQVTLSAKAYGVEGDISSNINWSSQIDGELGVGETITADITEGLHRIRAIVTDELGNDHHDSFEILALDNDDTVDLHLQEIGADSDGYFIYLPPATEFAENVYFYAVPDQFFEHGENEWNLSLDGLVRTIDDGRAQIGGPPSAPHHLQPGQHTASAEYQLNLPNFPNVNRTFTGSTDFVIFDSSNGGLVDDVVSTDEGTPVTINVLANDQSKHVQITEVTDPANGWITLAPDNEAIIYVPDAGFVGVDSFTYSIRNGTATVTVTVNSSANPGNGGVVDDAATTQKDTSVTINFLANDAFTDPLLVVGVTDPGNGTLAPSPDGQLTIYTPNAGFVGTDTFVYTIEGGYTGTVTVTVTGQQGSAPITTISGPTDGSSYLQGASVTLTGSASDAEDGDLAGSIQWSSSLDGALGTGVSVTTSSLSVGSHTITASVTDSDSNTSTQSITVQVTANTAPSATITGPADGSSYLQGASVTLTGSASDAEDGDLSTALAWSSSLDGALGTGASVTTSSLSVGSHTITASVTDSDSNTTTQSITVQVTANTAPSATITGPADGSSYLQGASVTLTGSASDAEDGDLSTALAWSSSLDGALGTGASVTTSSLSVGSHTITASVTDSDNSSGNDTINLTITSGGGNNAPTAVDDTATTALDTAVTVDVLANDSDADSNPLTVTAVTQPANGAVAFTASDVTYTPNTGYTGTDSFAYTADDGNGGTDIATVTVTVNGSSNLGIVFSDDFETDQSWIVNPAGTDTATGGVWERGNPEETSFVEVYQLGTTVSGSYDLVTGALAGVSANTHDVDGGVTSVRSPDIVLPSLQPGESIELSYSYYYAYRLADEEDFFRVTLVGNSGSTVLYEEEASSADRGGVWKQRMESLDSFAGQTVYLLIEVSDEEANDTMEAGVDDVKVEVVLSPDVVFSDDFETDQGWTVNPNNADTATDGLWERSNPEWKVYSNGIKQWGTTPSGSHGLVTEAIAGSTFSNEIDGGITSIRSPDIVLPTLFSTEQHLELSFAYYFAHISGANTDDYLRVTLVAPGGTEVLYEELGDGANDNIDWSTLTATLDSYAGQTVHLLIEAADGGSPTSIVEAGIDDVKIIKTGNAPAGNLPMVNILSPADGALYVDGDSIDFQGSATDVEDGDLAAAIEWSSSLDGVLGAGAQLTISTLSIGNHTIFASVTDTDGGISTAQAGLTIAANSAPVANNDITSTPQDVAVSINVLANDSDADSDLLSVTAVTQPANGSVSHNGIEVTYTPDAGYQGMDNFTYMVSDGRGGEATGSVSVVVTDGDTISVVFSDDFETDQGWVVNPASTDTATGGLWERANPEDTNLGGSKQLGTTVSGNYDLVTGALAGVSANTHDVDGGVTSVRSPDIVLPTLQTGESLELSYFYYLAYRLADEEDFFRVTLVGSSGSTVLYEEEASSAERNGIWKQRTETIDSFAGQTVYLLIEVSDEEANDTIESGIDDVMVEVVEAPEIVFNDDFETDQGWLVNPNNADTATDGLWERGNPEWKVYSNGIKQWGTTPSGSHGLVTEAVAGSTFSNEIDGGVTSIRSPDIVLPTLSSTEQHLELSLAYYFAHISGANADDYLRVTLVAPGGTEVLYEEPGESVNDNIDWSVFSTIIDDYAGQTVHLLIEAADGGSPTSIVEAGIDDVKIIKTD